MNALAMVIALRDVEEAQQTLVGGKAAQLAALTRIEGARVPPGFCVTTKAFEFIRAGAASFDALVERLARLEPDDRGAIASLSAELRQAIDSVEFPDELATAITASLARLGESRAVAVRSSATTEDLPAASSAGLHDTFLNVVGATAVLEHVRRCWASLFSERAVSYRLRCGDDLRKVEMAVVVQRLVVARASGVLFTADPVTSNRKVAAVEAVAGLGEALVSGLVTPDRFTVRDGALVDATRRQASATVTDAQVLELVRLGRTIEARLGRPQDVEWCLADDGFHVVQSRPITTLFPIPAAGDAENRVYLSVGHQQMMTDAMKPLGLSMWQLTAARPMSEAGSRLFVDATALLASPATRAGLLDVAGKSDPLMRDALQTIIDRGFVTERAAAGPAAPPAGARPPPLDTDSAIVDALISANRASVEALKRDIRGKSGAALFDFIRADLVELKRLLFDPRSHQVFMSAMEASWWLNEKLEAWLGEKNAADALTQSVPNNVTSEMGLALLDVADVLRPHAEVIALLRRGAREDFLDALPGLPGGREARDAIEAWLEVYGMRCVGEIDLTRPRWSERPAMLVPMLLGNVDHFAPGEAARRFEQGRRDAQAREAELLGRLRALPDGEAKAAEVKRMIDRLRAFIGYREYPKYGMISRSFVYKQALLDEAGRLVKAGVLREREDCFFLTFDELAAAVRTRRVDEALLDERKAALRAHQALTPPRVLTSEGECLSGSYRRADVPPGALVGLPVSAGVVEGRARVVHDFAEAELEAGDILVTAYTDPSWTPWFVTIGGLVTEVGGTMTHGAVIAREYGLPAVVAVERATQRIRDGQRVRVHGSEGYVELLE